MQRILHHNKGFTLVEVIITIIIAGILGAIALRSVLVVSDTAKIEQTKAELNNIGFAIVGNPELENNGIRSDFGYVGDVGAMPSNLDALHSNPGGYATWKGPYIENRFSQITNDYKEDAWGTAYSYSGVSISSSGSGSGIVKQVANSTDDILINQVKKEKGELIIYIAKDNEISPFRDKFGEFTKDNIDLLKSWFVPSLAAIPAIIVACSLAAPPPT